MNYSELVMVAFNRPSWMPFDQWLCVFEFVIFQIVFLLVTIIPLVMLVATIAKRCEK